MREQIAEQPPVVRRSSLSPYTQYPPPSPMRKRAGRPAPTTDDPYEDDGDYQQPGRMPSSARRYQAPLVRTRQEPTPPPQKRRIHWFVYVGIAMFMMIIGWTGFNALGSWIHDRQDDWTYGYPRTYQTDANVGHDGRVSHFICLNIHGEIEVIELQQGHPEASKVYVIMVLPADQDRVPVTISFTDINGDGKLDALVHVGSSTEIPMYNNGTGFQSQPPK